MHDTVMALSSNRLWRNLFWLLYDAGLWPLTGLLLLVFIADWRRTAVVALAFSALCTVTMVVIFHVNYTMPIWGGHERHPQSRSQRRVGGFCGGRVRGARCRLGAPRKTLRRVGRAKQLVRRSLGEGGSVPAA